LDQIPKISTFVNKRRLLAKRVADAVSNTPLNIMGGVSFDDPNSNEGHSWMMIPLSVEAGLKSKLQIQEYLEQNDIETRPVLAGNFLHQPAMKKHQKDSSIM
jgi:dTDP-4-amino-4,6-dideoxygalactose transaminase